MPIPPRFLVRLSHPCPYVPDMLQEDDEDLIVLPDTAIIRPIALPESPPHFGEVRVGWNEFGLGLTLVVLGKEQPLFADPSRPRLADGITLWLDTRDARANHRASRYCHQFHFLPIGGGNDGDEPMFAQSKINRALQDANVASDESILLRATRVRSGYRLAVWLSASALTGYEPEQHRRLGFYYSIRDGEFGESTLTVTADFPFAEDPSTWEVLELKSDEK